MNFRTRQRWHTARIVAVAMLLLVQSAVATLPNPGARSNPTAPVTSTGHATMPCEHGDCCDEEAPPGTPCDQMTSCTSGDCALRVIANLPAPTLVASPTQESTGRLPADAPQWLLTRHDTPLLRPPISG